MGGARRADGFLPPLRIDELRAAVLVHGAGSGPWAFDGWAETFAGLQVDALDLQAGLAVEHASMWNYEAVVSCSAKLLPRPLVLVGWSMGGLVAMMAARRVRPAALVVLEPSPPAEVQGGDPAVEVRTGTFDPEVVYGRFPAGIATRPESALARAERKRGVSVSSLDCPALVVHGDSFGPERGEVLAGFYGADELHVPGATHWDLVLDASVRARLADYVTRSTG